MATDTAALRPVEPVVREYAVHGIDPQALVELSDSAARRSQQVVALSGPEPAPGFAVAGVTWSGAAPAGLAFALRSQSQNAWSTWTPMVYESDVAPSSGSAEARNAVPGTDPFVVGDVDAVQLKVLSADGSAPRGLTLAVVDPGESTPTTAAAPSSTRPLMAAATPVTPTGVPEPVLPPSATPMPDINTRADWGADEGMRDCCVEYGEVHAGFVHHTVNSNDYTRAEVPSIIRGIYAYHTQSRGWRDIGYNFLVDKFGRIWEGRYGGITMPVVGAHTLDYNENSFAASAIGNYETAQPSQALLDAYARLFAWKLSLHGVRPGSTQDVAGTTFDAISGHRDAAQTACPGINLYHQIPAIIDEATRYQHVFRGRNLAHSFVRDAATDLLALDRADGHVSLARGTGAPGFDARQVARSNFSGHDQVTGVGDVTSDGLNDLMARTIASGTTEVLSGRGDGTFASTSASSARWADTDLFAGGGDLDGDGTNDVVARDADTGSLLFYAGRPSGGFAAGTVWVGPSRTLDSLSAAGDFDSDGERDLLARAGDALWVLLGNGDGLFPSRVRMAGDWSRKDVVSGGSDLTGDGRPDVVARSLKSQHTRIFANIDGTRLSPGIADLKTAALTFSLSPDVTGDHRPDLVTVTSRGVLAIVPARRQNWLGPLAARSASWPGMDSALVVGDWDGDGYVDAMTRGKDSGMWSLRRGNGRGGFSTPIGGWSNPGRGEVTPVGDFDGDGRPDLMGVASDGHVYLYPGGGDRGFLPRVLMRSGVEGSLLIGVGLWNSDGAPDVLVRTGTGQLLLYPGNGPGGLDEPTIIAQGFGGYDTLVDVGDLDGNGQSDLLGRTPNGDAWLIAGVPVSAKLPSGGFSKPQYLASGWSQYRLG